MSSFGIFLDFLVDKVMMIVMFIILLMVNIVLGKLSYCRVYRNEENVYLVVKNIFERSL